MKNHAKKMLSLSLITLAIAHGTTINNEPIHHHKNRPINVPPVAEGTPIGINGHEIEKMLYNINSVDKLLYGIPDHATKLRKGQFEFQGEMYSVSTLAEYELEHPNMTPAMKNELNDLFLVARKAFITIATPFIEQARGTKSVTLGFIREWGEKHHRESSGLFDWAKEKDGHEFETFKREIKTFQQLYVFCQDLVSFLSDLIQSCPRAWEQYMELRETKKRKRENDNESSEAKRLKRA